MVSIQFSESVPELTDYEHGHDCESSQTIICEKCLTDFSVSGSCECTQLLGANSGTDIAPAILSAG